jgi:hypothetical protein
MIIHACHLNNGWRQKIEEDVFQAGLDKKRDTISKITKAKRAGGVGKAVRRYSTCIASTKSGWGEWGSRLATQDGHKTCSKQLDKKQETNN